MDVGADAVVVGVVGCVLVVVVHAGTAGGRGLEEGTGGGVGR